MKMKEIFENTVSGSIATVAMPIGGVIKRNPDSFFGGVATNDPYPNTPDYMKKKKKKNVKWFVKDSTRY